MSIQHTPRITNFLTNHKDITEEINSAFAIEVKESQGLEATYQTPTTRERTAERLINRDLSEKREGTSCRVVSFPQRKK